MKLHETKKVAKCAGRSKGAHPRKPQSAKYVDDSHRKDAKILMDKISVKLNRKKLLKLVRPDKSALTVASATKTATKNNKVL